MREILFRGKRIDNGEWVEGNTYLYDPDLETTYIGGCEYYYNGEGLQRDEYCYQIDLKTRGLFTGLTDKNGTKIFEGDIVDLSYFLVNDYGIVKFGEYKDWDMSNDYPCGHVGFYIAIAKNNFKKFIRRDILYFAAECEVVGNIHDNPELLKQEAQK